MGTLFDLAVRYYAHMKRIKLTSLSGLDERAWSPEMPSSWRYVDSKKYEYLVLAISKLGHVDRQLAEPVIFCFIAKWGVLHRMLCVLEFTGLNYVCMQWPKGELK